MRCGRNNWIVAAAGVAAGIAALAGPFTLIERAAAQGEAQPEAPAPDSTAKADEVLSKASEAIFGDVGRERSVHSLRLLGGFAMPAMNISGTTNTVIDIGTGRIISTTEIEGIGTEAQGFDGEAAWANSSMQGPRLLAEDERAQLERQTTFYADADFREQYSAREHLGEEDIDGVRCHILSLTPADGAKPVKRWIDASTFLPVQQQFTIASPMGEVVATARFSDYREVGGVRMAHKTVNAFAGIEQVLTFTTIETNIAIDADTFTPPEPVRELLAKQ